MRWMRIRGVPDPTYFLDLHARGGFLKPWGRGRELIPAICVTQYARTPPLPPPQAEEREGLNLWML